MARLPVNDGYDFRTSGFPLGEGTIPANSPNKAKGVDATLPSGLIDPGSKACKQCKLALTPC